MTTPESEGEPTAVDFEVAQGSKNYRRAGAKNIAASLKAFKHSPVLMHLLKVSVPVSSNY